MLVEIHIDNELKITKFLSLNGELRQDEAQVVIDKLIQKKLIQKHKDGFFGLLYIKGNGGVMFVYNRQTKLKTSCILKSHLAELV